ncbi:hypothetical protein K2173_025184 [Erythroxylum novogranatense]|uniref:CP12 domain-containing protein n=1 Tax=Erythroxylum novogranatense TaxID=1862640 RepID=A0AAV8UGI5_9ROSI|nr:hypothetical protein K2173_025184 [Erythroxylum novogranatense]
MATVSGLNIYTPRFLTKPAKEAPKAKPMIRLNNPWGRTHRFGNRRMQLRQVRAAPEGLSDKVEQSIKNAEEACAGDPASGECVAAWDEVEELSAAASHERDRKKGSDPLENYCKDNPETDECRTYDN